MTRPFASALLLASFLASSLVAGCHVVVTDHCSDGLLDGSESDVDCGGACGACGVGRLCLGNSDCVTGICGPTARCQQPAVSGLPDSTGAPIYSVDPGVGIVVSPGTQAGYGVTANLGGSFRIVWTGEAAVTGTYSSFSGDIWTAGVFDSVTPGCGGACPLESGDTVGNAVSVTGGQVISFDTTATVGLDGLDFTVTGQTVFFDLLVDGVRRPELVFFTSGGVQSIAGGMPFGLTSP